MMQEVAKRTGATVLELTDAMNNTGMISFLTARNIREYSYTRI
jgi:hypothetical protein